jgi:small-conductance mechanosensitive channel
MQEFWTSFFDFFKTENAVSLFQAGIIIILGLLLARFASSGLVRLMSKQADAHQQMLIRRVSFYLIAGLFIMTALIELGFNFGILVGAAGILTVAIGFAAQTSASNVISGLFLLGEKAFAVGDVIEVGTTKGEVLSIDMLSVKIRTFDNLFVRVANENLIKSEITNLTRFPIRRLDMQIGVAYKENLRFVFDILNEVADANPLCLDEPKPLIIFRGFGESSLDMQFSVWTQRENYVVIKTQMHVEVKEAFDAAGIEIPFPHRTLFAGSTTEPFPVRVITDTPTG